MSLSVLAQPRVPRAAFGKIVRNEARLAWRQPSGLIAGVGISLALLIIFGEIPAFRQSSASLGSLSAFDVYIPILIAFAISVLALTYLPGPLVSYREQGILRRLSTTPVPPSWVLAAQMVVQACLMAISVALLIVVSVVFFAASAPKNPAGMVLAIALTIVAMFAIGLSIAAAARTAGAARGSPTSPRSAPRSKRSRTRCSRVSSRRRRSWSSQPMRSCSATWPCASSGGNSAARSAEL